MTAAAFATLFLWLAIIILFTGILAAVETLLEWRDRQHRIRRLRERRRYLDRVEPRRWTT